MSTQSGRLWHWDGSRWRVVPSGGYGGTHALAARSPGTTWLAGYDEHSVFPVGGGDGGDAGAWVALGAREVKYLAFGHYVLGLAAPPAGDVWAVGFSSRSAPKPDYVRRTPLIGRFGCRP
jgi:hypothetical protein